MFEAPLARLAQDDLERRYDNGAADRAEERARLLLSLQRDGELSEVIFGAEPVLAKLLAEGKTDSAGAVLQAVFEDYVEAILDGRGSAPMDAAKRALGGAL